MLKVITGAKKENDTADAEKFADLLRRNLLPECYMAPEARHNLQRMLRYRNFLVREAVKMKTKTACLLMGVGAEYNKSSLHGTTYFQELLCNLDHVPESALNFLLITRSRRGGFAKMEKNGSMAFDRSQ